MTHRRTTSINLAFPTDDGVTLLGFDKVEQESIDFWRWGVGREHSIRFSVNPDTTVRFYYCFRLPLPASHLLLRIGDKTILDLKASQESQQFSGSFDHFSIDGRIELRFESAGSRGECPGDQRPLSFVMEYLVAIPGTVESRLTGSDLKIMAHENLTPFCRRPFERIRINSEGGIFSCCWQRKIPFGHLKKSSLAEAWNSAGFDDVRRKIAEGKLPAACRIAEGCPHFGQRRLPSAPSAKPYPGPVFLDIDLPNSHCNIGGERPSEKYPACLMCERSHKHYRFEENLLQDFLPAAKPLLPHLKRLHIQGVAEPFWRDAIFGVLDGVGYQRDQHDCTVSTYTNGTVFNGARQARILDRCGSLNITVSLDAASPTTYQTIRRLPAFNRVLANIAEFSRRRDPKIHLLRISNNINTLNVGEVREMVRIAAAEGVDEVEFNTTGGVPDICINESNAHLFAEAARIILEESAHANIPVTFINEFSAPTAPYENQFT